MLRTHGVTIHSTGGETADVGDLVRTIIGETHQLCLGLLFLLRFHSLCC